MKRVLTVGGGSGGHVTPIVAVIKELKEKYPRAEIRFWSDHHFEPQARSIMADYSKSIRVQTLSSGKFRRYHNLSKLQHLTIPSVIFPNILDTFLVLFGIGQSLLRLILWRPNVIFANGGYVCLPVGYAAWLLRIPVVIHDGDAVPGLTNRLLAPLATHIATGMPLNNYDYPANKSSYVGIAIDQRYKPVDDKKRSSLKEALGFDPIRPLTVVTGGGQGSRQINDVVAVHLNELLEFTNVLLLAGSAQFDELNSLTPQNDPRFVLKDFLPGLHDVLGAADVVVSRAGATALLELAAIGSPTIIIPSKRLAWQIGQADYYIEREAVLPLDEDVFENPNDRSLVDAVRQLVDDAMLAQRLGRNLHKLARPHAAREMAGIIERAARKRS